VDIARGELVEAELDRFIVATRSRQKDPDEKPTMNDLIRAAAGGGEHGTDGL
jgi:hypothetical protein